MGVKAYFIYFLISSKDIIMLILDIEDHDTMYV